MKGSRYMPDSTGSLRPTCLPVALAVVSALLASTAAQAADGDATAITIYSSALPGAIPPEMYRPIPGAGVPNAMAVPGYAMVRQERPHQVSRTAARP